MKRSTPARGFSLVEVAIALGIASFCLIVLIGLLPVGFNVKEQARSRSSAMELAARVADDIRGTVVSGTTTTTPVLGLTIPFSAGETSHVLDQSGHVVTNLLTKTGRLTIRALGATNAQGTASYAIKVEWPSESASPVKFETLAFAHSGLR